MEHPECETRSANYRFPWYFKAIVLCGAGVLWMLCKTVEIRDWLVRCDPIEVLVALWALVCAGLFLAGVIVAIL